MDDVILKYKRGYFKIRCKILEQIPDFYSMSALTGSFMIIIIPDFYVLELLACQRCCFIILTL